VVLLQCVECRLDKMGSGSVRRADHRDTFHDKRERHSDGTSATVL
jgi:hypothetical protein